MGTLYLIRHGETALNVARVLQPADTPLSARGLAQAAALAQRLKSVGLGAIVSSDLPRALQTAQAIAAACGLPIATTPLLQERNFGDLRGLAYDAIAFDPLQADAAPPGGESMDQFRLRVAQAWQAMLQQHAALEAPLAVVTHGLVIREWLRGGHVDFGSQVLPERMANTAVTLVDAQAPHTVRWLNDISHLDRQALDDPHSLSGG